MQNVRAGLAIAFGLAAGVCGEAAHAQSNPVYVPQGPAKAVLYRPDAGPGKRTGVLVMHRTVNYLSHPACREFSSRGFVVLCMNSRFDNNEVRVVWEDVALDVKAGVEFLRKQPGVEKVALFGHSGGAPTMAFYQAVAENGVAFCQDPQRLTRCKDDLAGLPKADAIVFADAHPGYPLVVLRGFNPSLLDEQNPPTGKVDPSLDPFSEANGYNPKGRSTYSEEFRTRYYAAQSARMNRLIEHAQKIKAQMAQKAYGYPDNEVMVIPLAGNPVGGPGGSASLHVLDPTVPELMRTAQPRRIVRNSGEQAVDVAHSVARPEPGARETNRSFNVGAKLYSVDSFLSANAVRSTNSLDGVEHCSSNNSTVCAVQKIAAPQLFMAMGAANFIRDNEQMFEASAARDKDYAVIEGATHGFTPCKPCEPAPGAYDNATKNTFDYAAAWLNAKMEK